MKGSLAPGKYADVVVLSHDILTIPDESIREARVVMTIIDGAIVHDGRWDRGGHGTGPSGRAARRPSPLS